MYGMEGGSGMEGVGWDGGREWDGMEGGSGMEGVGWDGGRESGMGWREGVEWMEGWSGMGWREGDRVGWRESTKVTTGHHQIL